MRARRGIAARNINATNSVKKRVRVPFSYSPLFLLQKLLDLGKSDTNPNPQSTPIPIPNPINPGLRTPLVGNTGSAESRSGNHLYLTNRMQFDLQINRELDRLRKTAEKKGLPYQSLVNEILAGEMRKAS